MRIAFTSTQRGLSANQANLLRSRLVALNATLFIHGGCTGGDDQGDQIAASLEIPREVFPSTALEKSVPFDVLRSRGPVVIHERLPALKRNPLVVKRGERLLACPQQPHEIIRSGTWTTVRHGRRLLGEANVEIIIP